MQKKIEAGYLLLRCPVIGVDDDPFVERRRGGPAIEHSSSRRRGVRGARPPLELRPRPSAPPWR
jgi:hypothetical protein